MAEKILRGKMVIRTIVKLRHRWTTEEEPAKAGQYESLTLQKKKLFKRVRRWSGVTLNDWIALERFFGLFLQGVKNIKSQKDGP